MKKLNKKGFTLVELLAVIVILALLIVVAVSTVGNVQNNAKKSAMETEGKKIIAKILEDTQAYNIDPNYKFTYSSSTTAKLPNDGTTVITFNDSTYNLYVKFALNASNVGIIEGSTYCIEDTTGAMYGTISSNALGATSGDANSGKYVNGHKCNGTNATVAR